MLDLLHSLWRAFKMDNAMREQNDGSQCVACDSRNTTLLGPDAYRCQDCGYEGGDGWADLARQRREAEFARMSPARRRASAHEDLRAARTLLLSGIGELERASSRTAIDMAGLDPSTFGEAGHGHAKHAAMSSGVGLLLEAKRHVQDAQAKLDTELPPAADVEVDGADNWMAAMDLQLDNMFTDLAYHDRIRRTLGQARQLLAAVEQALGQHFGDAMN